MTEPETLPGLILGIESSCDDTAIAVLRGREILSNIISSQDEVHRPYGGIVPELASRQHIRNVLPVLDRALSVADIKLDAINGVAVTMGPGLVGSLLVGVSFAKAIAYAHRVPLVGVNHLEGHLLGALIERDVEFPFLCLLASGGHTSLYLAHDWARYQMVGCTRDDAAGEAFDKAGKMLGLGYPGGRIVDALARSGNPQAYRFPRANVKTGKYDFSYSGLKTALRQHLKEIGEDELRKTLSDIAASYQEALIDSLVKTTVRAAVDLGVQRIVVAGGVSANSRLRTRMGEVQAEFGKEVFFSSLKMCTDNAAMIAFAGARRLGAGKTSGLDLNVSAVLPLECTTSVKV